MQGYKQILDPLDPLMPIVCRADCDPLVVQFQCLVVFNPGWLYVCDSTIHVYMVTLSDEVDMES